jgi:hypothetical protein
VATEIIVALIGLIGVLSAAILGAKYRSGKGQLNQAQRELDFQHVALGFSEFVAEWAEVSADVKRLMDTTIIDRFIIFRAWNGSQSPRWTTAIYQQRADNQDVVTYIHVDLDEDYQERIRRMVAHKGLHFVVREIPDSIIKSVYMSEGVTSSYWAHLHSFDLEDSTSRAVVYCSFATHSHKELDDSTMTKCLLIASRLRGIVQDMHNAGR